MRNRITFSRHQDGDQIAREKAQIYMEAYETGYDEGRKDGHDAATPIGRKTLDISRILR